ncbi:MAG TPA: ribonuclease HII [Thermomicrobiales bacterium]|nr:ribonuclease HII [Thermomicrobiales bacterium]
MNDVAPDMLTYETGLIEAGYRTIVGIDEVGRGALAGPIVAAAVVLPNDVRSLTGPWLEVCDSKTLTPRKRAELAQHIEEHAQHVAVAMLDAAIIDRIGIGPANRRVMELSLERIEEACDPDFLLLDALTIEDERPQIGVIDGDACCLSIAAASIVAKVHRDNLMSALAGNWPHYQWERNKGYGVASHLDALRRVGPCLHHRQSFRPVRECGPVTRA